MTEDEARMIGKAIREEAKLIQIPIENEMERRAICLKLAIETKGVTFSLKNDASPTDAAASVIEAARLYEAYVTGPTQPEAKRELASQLLRSASTDEGYREDTA
jgi:hypothetical protein